ncbi:MAG: hypothetical protein RR802_05960 [Erysipelotrichaceae bacterium]
MSLQLYNLNDNKISDVSEVKDCEYGSNANGTWIKYANGRCEIILTTKTTKGYTSPYGSVYSIASMINVQFPFTLTKVFYVQSSAKFSGMAFTGSTSATKDYVQCWCINPIRCNDGDYETTVVFYIVGTWK